MFNEEYNRWIPDGVRLVEKGNHIFLIDEKWPGRRCYDPFTLTAIALTAVGTVQQIKGTLQQGKDANEIAKARAAVDIENAEAVDAAADEEAKIKREKGRRLISEQKSIAAAGNIRINVGAPLVIETETNAAITRDIGFALKRGRTESDAFRSSAALEITGGKVAKKQSRQRAFTQGIQGFGSIAFMAASVPGAPDVTNFNSTIPGSSGISPFAANRGSFIGNFP